MRRRRGIALAIALTVLLAIGGALRWLLASPASQTETVEPQSRASRPALSASRGDPATTAAAAPSAQSGVNLALATAQELRQAARYPRSSQPLHQGDRDPILREREVSRNVFPGPNGEAPDLTVFPDQVSFEHPDPVVLYAYLSAGDRHVSASRIEGDVIDANGQHIFTQLEYNDSGRGADHEAGDLVYTADVPADAAAALSNGAYLVRVRARTDDGRELNGTSGFLYSRPDAQLTGNYDDALVGGNLEIQTEVEVQNAGRFHLEGTLYTQGGIPIAWAQNALQLSPGTHQIPLSFFGLILREHAEDGPYVLRFAALSTTTSMPNALNRLAENAHVTQAYHATDFSDQPYADARLLDAASRLDARAPGSGGNPPEIR